MFYQDTSFTDDIEKKVRHALEIFSLCIYIYTHIWKCMHINIY